VVVVPHRGMAAARSVNVRVLTLVNRVSHTATIRPHTHGLQGSVRTGRGRTAATRRGWCSAAEAGRRRDLRPSGALRFTRRSGSARASDDERESAGRACLAWIGTADRMVGGVLLSGEGRSAAVTQRGPA
jgi:hypothetical protein